MSQSINNLLATYGIPIKLASKSFDDFHNQDVTNVCKSYVLKFNEKAQKEGIGLFFEGISGSGKSMLAAITLKDLIIRNNLFAAWETLDTIHELWVKTWKKDHELESNRRLYSSSILVIDDIPRMFSKARDPNEILDMVLRRRIAANKVTFVTCSSIANLSPQTIALLRECTVRISLPEFDFRSRTNNKIE